MKAIDTNILARLILQDDEQQLRAAQAAITRPIWVSNTVWIELGWVLEKRLRMERAVIGAALSSILAIDMIHTTDRDGLAWAIERYRRGADWADMIHLVAARGVADTFLTFDRGIAEHGEGAFLPVETLV